MPVTTHYSKDNRTAATHPKGPGAVVAQAGGPGSASRHGATTGTRGHWIVRPQPGRMRREKGALLARSGCDAVEGGEDAAEGTTPSRESCDARVERGRAMVTALLVGLVLGFVLAMPPGPIAIAILRQALAGQAREGVAMALGASAMDIVYAFIAGWASSALFESLQGTVRAHAWGLLALQGGCIVVLVVCGLRYLRTPSREVAAHARQEAQARTRSASSPYLLGVLLALPALASPTFLPSLIFLMGVVQARGWVGDDMREHVLYAVGFGAGSALWFVLLLRTLTPLRARLSPQVLPRLSRVAGGALLLCAVLLTYHVVTATPWSRLPGWSWQHVGR